MVPGTSIPLVVPQRPSATHSLAIKEIPQRMKARCCLHQSGNVLFHSAAPIQLIICLNSPVAVVYQKWQHSGDSVLPLSRKRQQHHRSAPTAAPAAGRDWGRDEP